MPFHRTPAEMAADASFARSGVGESSSCHMLWLTAADLEELGPEPAKSHRRVDFDDPAQVAASRAESTTWKEWWGRASAMFRRRQDEALSDAAWYAEYDALLRERRAAGPAEMDAMRERWEAFDLEHPFRGLTDAEKAESAENWRLRWVACREHNKLARKDPEDPRLPGLLADMKARDRRNDQLNALSSVRPTYQPSLDRYAEDWPQALAA